MGVLGLIALGVVWYMDDIRPYLARTLFNKMKDGYKDVIDGKITFSSFKVRAQIECQPGPKDTDEMIRFKMWLISILQDDSFFKEAFSKPGLTIGELSRMRDAYDPDAPVIEPRQVIPEIFKEGRGKEIMDALVDKHYCNAETLEWIGNSNYTTELQGVFADAICKSLRLPYKGRFEEIKKIWGNKNYTQYFDQARLKDTAERERLQSLVREIFPTYELPDRQTAYKIPKEDLYVVKE